MKNVLVLINDCSNSLHDKVAFTSEILSLNNQVNSCHLNVFVSTVVLKVSYFKLIYNNLNLFATKISILIIINLH